jgi:hypothetical protein
MGIVGIDYLAPVYEQTMLPLWAAVMSGCKVAGYRFAPPLARAGRVLKAA